MNLEGFKVVINAGFSVLRLLSTVNAGGLLALLGFVGAVAGKDRRILESTSTLTSPMGWFAVGLILSVVAVGGMYFAQMFYTADNRSRIVTNDPPHIFATTTSLKWNRAGVLMHGFVIACVFASFITFVVGVCLCLTLIQSIKL